LSNLPVEARDVKLLTILLVEHPLELGWDFEPSFFVDASWVIAAKHGLALCDDACVATGALARRTE
jgi:hypothetical protein